MAFEPTQRHNPPILSFQTVVIEIEGRQIEQRMPASICATKMDENRHFYGSTDSFPPNL